MSSTKIIPNFYHDCMKTPAELIAQFLRDTKTKKVVFCNNCRIHRSSLHKYLKGEPIHPLKARNIEYGTGGKLKAQDLLKKNILEIN